MAVNPALAMASSLFGRVCSALHPIEQVAYETGIVLREDSWSAILIDHFDLFRVMR